MGAIAVGAFVARNCLGPAAKTDSAAPASLRSPLAAPQPVCSTSERMTAAELMAFAAQVRAEATAALAQLDTVSPETLSPQLRVEYDTVRDGWLRLLALTADDVVDLHVAACEAAGRELTDEELKGLLGKQ